MPSKKKSKPSFEVPEDLQSAPQAGWVYRSDRDTEGKMEVPPEAQAAPEAASDPVVATKKAASRATEAAKPASASSKPRTQAKPQSKTDSGSGILDLAARTISAGFETMGGAMLLATRIFMAPFSMGLRVLRLK